MYPMLNEDVSVLFQHFVKYPKGLLFSSALRYLIMNDFISENDLIITLINKITHTCQNDTNPMLNAICHIVKITHAYTDTYSSISDDREELEDEITSPFKPLTYMVS